MGALSICLKNKRSHSLSEKLTLRLNPNRMTSAESMAHYVLGNQLANDFGGLCGKGC